MSTGSSNRLSYDECEHNTRNLERVDPFQYQLYSGKYLRCNWCGIKNQGRSELEDGERITIESDLLNIDRRNSRCSINKYQPQCDNPLNCNLNAHDFSPARLCERDVVWTNLIKPTNPGINPPVLNNRC
jgi:hypothetical protein